MNKLSDLVASGSLTEENKANIVLSLIRLADSGKKLPGALACYFVDGKFNACFLNEDSSEVTLASPEYFTNEDVDLRDKSMFTVGLLAYYIYNGITYYDKTGITPLGIYDLIENGSESLIEEDGLSGVYAGLTAWKAGKRYEGVEAFFRYVKANFKGRYTVNYRCEGSTVRVDKGELTGDIAEYPEADTVEKDGRKYKINKKCSIPFRAGNTEYTVNVTPIRAPEPAPTPERAVSQRHVESTETESGNTSRVLPDRKPREPRVTTETPHTDIPSRLPNRATDVQREPAQPPRREAPPARTQTDTEQTPRIVNGKVQPVAVRMNLPENISNYALVEFVCDGRLVHKTDAKNFKRDIIDFPLGKWLTGSDGNEYITLATADIISKTGAYKYTIPVKKAKGKIKTYIMLSGGDNRYEKLVIVGERESATFCCYADSNGLNAPLVGGYVDSGSGEVLYNGRIGVKLSLTVEKKVRVIINSYRDGNYITVDVVEYDSGRVLVENKRINMPVKTI